MKNNRPHFIQIQDQERKKAVADEGKGAEEEQQITEQHVVNKNNK